MIHRSAFQPTFAHILRLLSVILVVAITSSAESQDEWKKTVEAAKKEAKIVAGGPPTAVLRKQFKETFEQKFGIELELVSAPGPRMPARPLRSSRPGFVTSMFSTAVPARWSRS